MGAGYWPDMHMSNWALSEFIEAATRCGQPEAATDAQARLTEMAHACSTDWIIGVDARAHALAAHSTEAEELYRCAIECFERTPFRTEIARAHLLYGEWLRSQGRSVDARLQLGTAYEFFRSIGMEAFADRSRRELLAAGGKVRQRPDGPRRDLTPQEEQIARLALDGRTNPEIAAQLYLSPRTVQYHLGKVFQKLAISSRSQLHTVLAQSAKAKIIR